MIMKKLLILFYILFAFIGCKNPYIEHDKIGQIDTFPPEGFVGLPSPTTFISKEPLIEGTDIYLYVKIMNGNSYIDGKEIVYGIGTSDSEPKNFDSYNPIRLLSDVDFYFSYEAYFEGLNPATSSIIQKGNIYILGYDDAVITFTEGTSYDNKEIDLIIKYNTL